MKEEKKSFEDTDKWSIPFLYIPVPIQFIKAEPSIEYHLSKNIMLDAWTTSPYKLSKRVINNIIDIFHTYKPNSAHFTQLVTPKTKNLKW